MNWGRHSRTQGSIPKLCHHALFHLHLLPYVQP